MSRGSRTSEVYQHGRLLAPEIVDYMTTLATSAAQGARPRLDRNCGPWSTPSSCRYDPEY